MSDGREESAPPRSAEDAEAADEVEGGVETSYQATGHPAVDEAMERLRQVDGAPLAEHVGVYDDVHRRLQDALTDVDEG